MTNTYAAPAVTDCGPARTQTLGNGGSYFEGTMKKPVP
jgi:hypothetical protein